MAIIATCSYALVDLYDPIQQDTMPDFSPIGALWLDTSLIPNQLKRWDGEQWSIVNDTAGIISRLTEAELLITDEAIVGTVRSSIEYYNDLSGKVSSEIYEAKMSALDNAIELKASNEYVSDLEARVSTAEQTITPSEITSVVRTSEEYRADISDISGQIGILQTSLADKVGSSDIADMATTAYVQTVQSTEVEQRNNAIVLAVQEETNRAVAVEGEIKTFTDSARTYFSFDLDGLNIGKQGSPFSTLLGDSKLSFKQGGVEVAYVQYNRLYISIAEIMDILTIGNAVVGYTDVKTENSGVSAVWRAS